MTIDERLDRLTQRHEALTQTVELLAHMQVESEKRSQEAFRRHEEMLARVVDSIDRLSQIAVLHDRRISGLEDERPQ